MLSWVGALKNNYEQHTIWNVSQENVRHSLVLAPFQFSGVSYIYSDKFLLTFSLRWKQDACDRMEQCCVNWHSGRNRWGWVGCNGRLLLSSIAAFQNIMFWTEKLFTKTIANIALQINIRLKLRKVCMRRNGSFVFVLLTVCKCLTNQVDLYFFWNSRRSRQNWMGKEFQRSSSCWWNTTSRKNDYTEGQFRKGSVLRVQSWVNPW